MNLKADQRQIVEQIKRQLQISESYSEHRYLPIMEGEEHLIQSKDGFDFFLIPIDEQVADEHERLEGLFVSIRSGIFANPSNKISYL